MNSVRRAITGLGMLGLLWLGVQLVQGSLSLADAGLRAALLAGAVAVFLRIADRGFAAMLRSLETAERS